MSLIQTQTGVPVPVKKNWRLALSKMEVNESALLGAQYYNSVRAVISRDFHASADGMQFTTAKEGNGFRVWRIA